MFLRKLLVGVFVIAFTATAANAYTVVLRSGRQVEIPNTFTVTNSTLTYEKAPGIQITIQLSSIDVAATERLNNQPGSLSATAAKPAAVQPAQVQTPRARRSITNQDLEAYRRARLESERQRKDLGLPSAEERRKETEEIEDRTQEQIRSMRTQEELDFWRNRAITLETQMVSTQDQMRANQFSGYPWAFPIDGGVVPIGNSYGFDRFGILNRFDRFGLHKFGFSRFGFNNPEFKGHFPANFRGRLRFTTPKSVGGSHGGSRGGFHGGGRGGGRGGRR